MPLEIEQNLNLTFDDLIPIRDLVAETSGLYFEENKFYFIEKRIAKRIRATNTQTARNYFRLLKLGQNTEEMHELISLLTTNETYFYRYLPQLESFVEEALPIVIDLKKKKGDKTLNIWSAGCSTGEEPYTILILLKERLKDYNDWTINMYATDIDHRVLEKAKRGKYEKRAVKDIPPTILEKYFKEEASRYFVHDEIKQGVNFDYLNLMDRKAIRKISDMDFVFCRNVLIYFDDKAKKQVVNSIYDSLAPGGFIFLGHAESVGKISATFKLIKLNKSLSYQK